jgi:hypothetical protein
MSEVPLYVSELSPKLRGQVAYRGTSLIRNTPPVQWLLEFKDTYRH